METPKTAKTTPKIWIILLIIPWACLFTSILLEAIFLHSLQSGSTGLLIVNIAGITLTGIFFIGLLILSPIAIFKLVKASRNN